MPVLPDLDDVLGTLRVVALPLVTRFRGITVREAALFEGPEGWTEFAPFAEYDDAEAARWLAADHASSRSPHTTRHGTPVERSVRASFATRSGSLRSASPMPSRPAGEERTNRSR